MAMATESKNGNPAALRSMSVLEFLLVGVPLLNMLLEGK